MMPVLLGVGIVLAGAAGLTRLLSKLLFGVNPTDAPAFTGAAVLLAVVALAASSIPARRAVALDPMSALRCE